MVSIKTDYVISPGTAKTIGHILVVHATADNGATAANIAAYEHRTWRSAFVHYAVDDKGAYQIGKPGYKAYGAGNVNKYAPVQIELCQFTDKARAKKAYSNFVALIKQMAAKYSIPLTLDDSNRTAGIKSHDWCRKTYGGTTHTDPWAYLTSIGISKAQFAADIKAGKADAKVSTTVSKPAAKAKASTSKLAVDGMWGAGTTRRLQQVYGTPVDGIISKPSTVIKAIQHALKVTADGLRGPKTYKAMQHKAGTPADGKLSKVSPMVKYMQRQLNAGKKPF